ncbi:XRE family transcriptional regulator [Streptosporangium sp. NPDC020145]|uniref:helix-turn-helix domain-containing protein n=1 Tax=Streptosporangium sp. NPDC020145 TaxID=3154694 RepID=UPI0034420D7D
MLHHSPMECHSQTPRPALESNTHDIGLRIRQLREERGMSLSELARRAGVGKATLSGLENGTRNPTLETLWSVTAELGVPLAVALGTAPAAPGTTIRGTAVAAVLLEVFEEREVTYELYRMTVPAGAAQTSPAHHRGVTEHITVFSGTLRVVAADRTLTAGAGEHIGWVSDVPHSYEAVGDQDVHASLLIRYPQR